MDASSEDALNAVQPTWRNKIGTKFMFSLTVSEGLANYLVFDTDLSFAARTTEFPVPFSRWFPPQLSRKLPKFDGIDGQR